MRYVNRQRGAGTRVLLDHELARRGIAPDAVDGYAREEHTHLSVAAAITAGRADCGLGVLAAARAFGLDFVPVTQEPYDLVVDAAALDEPVLAPLWDLLADAEFQRAVEALSGYATQRRAGAFCERACADRHGGARTSPVQDEELDERERVGPPQVGPHRELPEASASRCEGSPTGLGQNVTTTACACCGRTNSAASRSR